MAKHDVNVLIKARDEASRKFGLVGKSAMTMGSILRTVAGIAGTYFSARAIIRFAKDSVAAYARQEAAVLGLKAALEGLGQAQDLQGLKDFAAQIQKLTVHGDEATMELMKLGASIGGLSGETLKAATVAAIGFAKAFGIDAESAMTMVSKAAQGNVETFSRYGIKLDKNLTAQEKFNAILAKGAGHFRLAEAETKTLRGQVAQLSNAWGDAKENLGEYIATMPGLQAGMASLVEWTENLGLRFRLFWKEVQIGAVVFWEELKHLFAVQIPELLQWFGRNWKDVFIDILNGTMAVILNIQTNIGNFFRASWSLMKGKGFDFQWTGLLDGFESAIEEMPEIAKRGMGPLEQRLKEEEEAMLLQLGQNIQKREQGGAFDIAGLLAGAGKGGLPGVDRMGPEGKTAVAAQEARFLGGAAISPMQKSEGLLAKILASQEKQNRLLERQAQQEQRRPRERMAILASLA